MDPVLDPIRLCESDVCKRCTAYGYSQRILCFRESISATYLYHHHHDVVQPTRLSLTLSRHPPNRSSPLAGLLWQHPVSSHSCCMYVRAGRPTFTQPYMGVHRSTSLMSSSLLYQQCPACLVRLTWIVFMMEGRWPYSWGFVGCCLQDLFNIARSIWPSG